LNFLLQGKLGKTFETLARLAINSTLGLGGLIDIAAKPGIGLPYRRNGLANTLGFYGVGPGAYLYLPVTGATTVRDLFGSTLDQALLPLAVGRPFNRPAYAAGYFVINGLDQRLAFDEELAMIAASDDPYTLRRETYLARRAREIAALKGAPVADEEEEAAGPDADAGASAAPLPPHSRLRLPERLQLTAPPARGEGR
jgi:phospholipid-binding lipoprotein MlaA